MVFVTRVIALGTEAGGSGERRCVPVDVSLTSRLGVWIFSASSVSFEGLFLAL